MKFKVGCWYLTKPENWEDDGQYINISKESNKPDYIYGILITHKHHGKKGDWYPKNRIDRKLNQKEVESLKDKIMIENL